MSTVDDIEVALRAVLPSKLHTHVLALAQLLADVASGELAIGEGHARLAANPSLILLLRKLAGQTLNLGDVDVLQQITITGGTIQGDIVGKQFVIHLPAPQLTLHQLRAPVSDFVGRTAEIEQLVAALDKAVESGTVAAISGVRGMGGIGKTELAYVVGQRLTPLFPAAQIVLALRGAGSDPLTPEQALRNIITAFEPEAKLPDDLAQLQGLYRAALAGKRAFILADDAKDDAQVEPLLPPVGCVLLVTSRNRFAIPGMMTIDLETLRPDEARTLLLTICPRIGTHAVELAELCGYLPLALRVSASLLASDDTQPVGGYLQKLLRERDRLTHLRKSDNPSLDVAASLNLSYTTLAPAAQQALCQASVFPASFDREAAEVVIAADGATLDLLGQLRRQSLLEWDATAERYDLHDLVRAFGVARLVDEDAVRLRQAQHYMDVAARTNALYQQSGEATAAGLALFDRERVQIDAGWAWAQEQAGDSVADRLLVAYANAMIYVGNLRYDCRTERIPQLEVTIHAAQRLGLQIDESAMLWSLGIAYAALGEVRRAIELHEQQLKITCEIGDRRGEGWALGQLGIAYAGLGDARRAIGLHEQQLQIIREVGDRREEGNALSDLGNAYAALGDIHHALSLYEQQLMIAREISDRQCEGWAVGNLGNAYMALGDSHHALSLYEQQLAITREISDRRSEGWAVGNLGNAYMALGDSHRAIFFYEQQLAIAREISDRRSEGWAVGNLGNAYARLDESESSRKYYEQALSIQQAIDDRGGEAQTSKALALLLEQQGDLAQAAELMQICVGYERDIDHPNAEQDRAHLDQLRSTLHAGQISYDDT